MVNAWDISSEFRNVGFHADVRHMGMHVAVDDDFRSREFFGRTAYDMHARPCGSSFTGKGEAHTRTASSDDNGLAGQ